MRGLGSGSFDPETLAILEAAFDEAWLTLKCNAMIKCGRTSSHAASCVLPPRESAIAPPAVG